MNKKKAHSREHGGSLGSLAELRRLANTLLVQGDFRQAESLYGDVLRRLPTDFEALHMLGVIALRGGQVQQAVALIGKAVRSNANHAQAFANLGSAYVYAGRPEDGIRTYEKALSLDSTLAGVLSNLGTAQQLLQRYALAAESFRRLLELEPHYDFACGNFFQCRRYDCDWRDFERLGAAVRAGLAAGKNVDRPFSFLSASGSGSEQLRCARLHADYLCSTAGPALWRNERYGHDRIRIAYVSADPRNHVVMELMQPILERHDRSRFQIVGLSFARAEASAAVALRSQFDQFIDASALADHDAAQLLRDLEVDIAVDLTGFTEGCRPGIFARRPAPVQVNFLGFPGTMGTTFHDYIIADEFVVPDSSRCFYSEHIVRLPDTFQANGPRAGLSARLPAPTRAVAGLPATGVVLCSFNNSYKLNPEVFGIWLRVMQAVPESVLWLVAEEAGLQQRLRAKAEMSGISCGRLIFARRLGYADHLARVSLADLFLDTFPFNGGATTTDALWAGVPLITCAGEAFASRMAGSLLRAIGLAELVAANPLDYEQLAVELATNRSKLAEFKARLSFNRDRQPLFDAGRYCGHLEAAYLQMWQRAERGDGAADLSVPHSAALAGR